MDIEMKIYEKLGVRKWKKFVLWLMCLAIRDPNFKGINYNIQSFSLKSVKKFRKWLWINSLIHVYGIIQCIDYIPYIINSDSIFSFSMFFTIICFLLNIYCVMLQRYNYIRIKKVLKRATRD